MGLVLGKVHAPFYVSKLLSSRLYSLGIKVPEQILVPSK